LTGASAVEPLLRVEKVQKSFGGLVVLDDVSLAGHAGETLALIGPNGAGKTTLFNIIAGALPASSGRVLLGDRDISRLRPSARCRLGVARTFQIPKPFSTLSVLENVEAAIEFGNAKRGREAGRAVELIEQVGLQRWIHESASSLSLGARKKLELVRALATDPSVILIDEVMGGLAAEEADEVSAIVRGLRAKNIAVIFVEHVLRAVMSIADRIVVLHRGRIIADGKPKDIAENDEVIDAYLGGSLGGASRG
jgi:branched-chain amino acid transport system ATP-binding protein